MEDFKKFVENENKKKHASQFNPNERILKFREFVDMFYQRVEQEWLFPFIERNEIHVTSLERPIAEQHLGQYTVTEKVIIIGGRNLHLRPAGTMVSGSCGRIDLIYEARSEMFVLVGAEINTPKQMLECMYSNGDDHINIKNDLVWKYVSKFPRLKYESITSDVFQKILLNIING